MSQQLQAGESKVQLVRNYASSQDMLWHPIALHETENSLLREEVHGRTVYATVRIRYLLVMLPVPIWQANISNRSMTLVARRSFIYERTLPNATAPSMQNKQIHSFFSLNHPTPRLVDQLSCFHLPAEALSSRWHARSVA